MHILNKMGSGFDKNKTRTGLGSSSAKPDPLPTKVLLICPNTAQMLILPRIHNIFQCS